MVVVQFNSQGLKNVRKNWELLKVCDVIVIQETFLEEKNMATVISKFYKDFCWFGKAATRKKSGRGRASGGHLVGIKKK